MIFWTKVRIYENITGLCPKDRVKNLRFADNHIIFLKLYYFISISSIKCVAPANLSITNNT